MALILTLHCVQHPPVLGACVADRVISGGYASMIVSSRDYSTPFRHLQWMSNEEFSFPSMAIQFLTSNDDKY